MGIPYFRLPLPLSLLPSIVQALCMERKLINQKGSSVTISSSKWPGEYRMSYRFSNGNTHIMFIKDIEEEVQMLLGEGYVEIN